MSAARYATLERPVTIKDVARQLGVSPSTVARALSDHPRIGTDTKELVRLTANRMGYVLNSQASMMRSGVSSLIGLVIPDIQNDFYSSIARVLSKSCEAQGFQLVLSISEDDPRVECEQVASLVSARVAGVIIVPTGEPERRTIDMLRRTRHVQLLRSIPRLAGDWFGIDDAQAIRTAAEHLISLGHTKIGYIGGRRELTTGKERLAGFRQAMAEAGLRLKTDRILLGEPTIAGGMEAMERLLADRDNFTGVILGSVGSTLGALQHCHRNRIATPRDLSIVGFGDAPGFEWWQGGLTTVWLPIEELANSCSDRLFRDIKVSLPHDEPSPRLRECSLIVRASTGPAA